MNSVAPCINPVVTARARQVERLERSAVIWAGIEVRIHSTAALVSVEAAEIARKTMERNRAGLAAYLRAFPGGEFERNRSPSRDAEL